MEHGLKPITFHKKLMKNKKKKMKHFFYLIIFTFLLCDAASAQRSLDPLPKCHTDIDGTQTDFFEWRASNVSSTSGTYMVRRETPDGNTFVLPGTGTVSNGFCNHVSIIPDSLNCETIQLCQRSFFSQTIVGTYIQSGDSIYFNTQMTVPGLEDGAMNVYWDNGLGSYDRGDDVAFDYAGYPDGIYQTIVTYQTFIGNQWLLIWDITIQDGSINNISYRGDILGGGMRVIPFYRKICRDGTTQDYDEKGNEIATVTFEFDCSKVEYRRQEVPPSQFPFGSSNGITVSEKCDCTGSNDIEYINGTNTITLTSGTFCSYSVTVIEGSILFTENSKTAPFNFTVGVSEGDSNKGGCNFLTNSVVMTGSTASTKAIISIIR